MNTFMVFLGALAHRILQGLAQHLWDRLWLALFDFAVEAEQKWKESGKGEEKKEWVMAKMLEFIEDKANLSWIQRQVIGMFVSEIINALVDEFNTQLGKDWGNRVEELQDELAGRIPFIT